MYLQPAVICEDGRELLSRGRSLEDVEQKRQQLLVSRQLWSLFASI